MKKIKTKDGTFDVYGESDTMYWYIDYDNPVDDPALGRPTYRRVYVFKDDVLEVFDPDIDKIIKVYEIVRDHKLYPAISCSFIDVESHNRAVVDEGMKLTAEEFALLKEMF